MLIFLRERLTIFATPKTGSTSVESVLAPHADIVLQRTPQLKHMAYHRYVWKMEKLLATYTDELPETCAVVRDPLDWLGSWYRFRQADWLAGRPKSTRNISFESFVDACLSDDPPPFAAVGSQGKFLTHPKTGAQVQHLFRHDAMEVFVAFVQERLGRPIALPRLNRSAAPPVAATAALRARLAAAQPLDHALYEAARH